MTTTTPTTTPVAGTLTARALLFDMDGTLVDSGAAVERTWTRFADRHGLDVAAILADSHGRPTAETVARHAPPGTDLAAETEWLVRQDVADTTGTVALPGAAALLAALPVERWALVTSASGELARRRMAAAGLPMPRVVVSADDVVHGKPDPEGYVRAAAALGVAPAEALVLEDAEAGLRAALAAGAPALVVGPHGGPLADGLPRITDFDGIVPRILADGIALELPASRP
ncbi:HAD-IA family hydrolase [Streptomyces sp. BI20]|uniref:HAD-IA family hydrolase n=1 Tax=Streptomyces sp. BI20 TaxID=3403460 RepID=UPI003C77093C